MSTEAIAKAWDFTPVIALLHAFDRPAPEDTHHEAHAVATPPVQIPSKRAVKAPTLGNFDRIWEYLGQPLDRPPPVIKPSVSDDLQFPVDDIISSSTPLDSSHVPEPNKTKEVHWKDRIAGVDARQISAADISSQLATAGLFAPDLSPSSTSISGKTLTLHRLARDEKTFSATDTSDIETDNDLIELRASPVKNLRGRRPITPDSSAPSSLSSVTQLFPSSVAPPKTSRGSIPQVPLAPSLPRIHVDHTYLQPLYTATSAQKKLRLLQKLLDRFPNEKSSLLHPSGHNSEDGIHVFVDCSNIMIGFYSALKKARGINPNEPFRQPPISYHSLTLLMERGRPAAKRVLVGSTHQSNILHDYMKEAELCGYELNILERVKKSKESHTPRSSRKSQSGNATSGQSSGSEGPLYAAAKMAEQGVDEILHMKMLESIVDTEQPSTIVLASGDAAVAEYSAGFLKNVERALRKGWNVEVLAWGAGLSYAYRNKDFQHMWKEQFRLIELDDYSEELLAVYA